MKHGDLCRSYCPRTGELWNHTCHERVKNPKILLLLDMNTSGLSSSTRLKLIMSVTAVFGWQTFLVWRNTKGSSLFLIWKTILLPITDQSEGLLRSVQSSDRHDSQLQLTSACDFWPDHNSHWCVRTCWWPDDEPVCFSSATWAHHIHSSI